MKHGNKTKKFVSVFLFASMALSFISPQINGNSSVLEPSHSNIVSDNLFHEAFDISQNEQIFENPLVGETSFIAIKTPLPAKKVVVISSMKRVITAYSSTPDQTDGTPFITASNSYVRDGIIAANFARFGTKVRFPTLYGDKIFVVEDRMNKRYPHRVDIWMQTREEAKEFGVKVMPVETVKETIVKEIYRHHIMKLH